MSGHFLLPQDGKVTTLFPLEGKQNTLDPLDPQEVLILLGIEM